MGWLGRGGVRRVTGRVGSAGTDCHRVKTKSTGGASLFLSGRRCRLFRSYKRRVAMEFSGAGLARTVLFVTSVLPQGFSRSTGRCVMGCSSKFIFSRLTVLSTLFGRGNISMGAFARG